MKTKFFLSGLLLVSSTLIASADVITLTPQLSDAEVNPSTTYNATTARVGESTSSGYGRAAVYVFAFPKIAFAEKIIGASFSVNLASDLNTFTFNGDLYSLGVSSSATPLPSDYFNGAYGTDTTNTAIQPHFVTPSTPVGLVSATSAGNSALASDLESYRALADSLGTFYYLRVSPDLTTLSSAFLGYNLSMADDTAHPPTLSVTTGPHPQQGRVLCEYWSNITGSNVSDLTSSPNYPNKPSAREFPTVMEIPANLDVNSGARMRGIFFPPTNGSYTFSIASDDSSQLMLSTDDTAAHAVVIASVTGTTTLHQWTKYPSQTSSAFTLQAGKGYYIEALQKQSTSSSNLSIGYLPPGASSVQVMPAANVAPVDPAANYTSGALLSTVTQGHPRLMLSPASVARLKTTVAVTGSLPASWWATIQAQATTILGEPVIAQPVVSTGSTNILGAARELENRVYYLGLVYQVSTDTTMQANCLSRIYSELQSAASWGSSSGSSGNWLADGAFLDVAETTHAFGIAYDWCYSGWTGVQRTFVLNTLVNQGLALGVTAYTPPTQSYINGPGNWTIVCDGGLCTGAMAVLGDETSSTPVAPQLLDDIMPAFFTSPAMLGEWGPDGAWPEGRVYWEYAAKYLSTFLSSLETSAATCYNFDRSSGVSSIGSYELYAFGPLNLSLNYSDDQAACFDLAGSSSCLHYFALKFNQPVYAWAQQQVIASITQPSPPTPAAVVGPYPTDLIWYDPRGATTAATPWALHLPTSTYYRGTGIISLRSAWNAPNALFAGIKVGFNNKVLPYGSSHEQLELGSFVFDALGVRWAEDLGRDWYSLPGYWHDYPSDTPDRWQYYRCRAEGNNTLVVNPSIDGGQNRSANALVTNFVSNSTLQQAIFDMTSAYNMTCGSLTQGSTAPVATAVTGAKRGFRFVNGTAQLQDEFSASTPVNLNWFMHTATSISLSPDSRTATLTPSSGNSRVQVVLQSPSTATFSVMNASPLPTSPNPSGQSSNSAFKKLWIQLPSTAGTTLTVTFCPYTNGNTPPVPPAVTPLANW